MRNAAGHYEPSSRSLGNYVIEVSPEFPGDGVWPHEVFSFDRDGTVTQGLAPPAGTAHVLRVEPHDRAPWIGVFPTGRLGGDSGEYAMASPTGLCVLVAGLALSVNVEHPGNGATVLGDYIRQVVTMPKGDLLLLVGFTDIEAFNSDGPAWRSPRLVLDDLRVERTTDSTIECNGYFGYGGSLPFVVDAATGTVISGERADWLD